MNQVILPGTTATGHQTTLGVMGGGQLGRMFVQAAQAMGYFTAVQVILRWARASPSPLVLPFTPTRPCSAFTMCPWATCWVSVRRVT